MDSKEIQKRLDRISDVMSERGLKRPEALASMNAHASPYVYLHWDEDGVTHGRTEIGRGETIGEAFEMADAILEAIPPKEDRDRAEFTRLLAQVIDKGNDIGIEVDMLNPLQAMMQKLSENAITYQVRPATPPAPYGFDQNDPMPF